jgi:hypothetical protein
MASGDDLTLLGVLGTALSGVATLIIAINTVWTKKMQNDVQKIHDTTETTLGEVVTVNGKTIGKLLDDAEGRRIVADVPTASQTSHDRKYVEGLEDTTTAAAKARSTKEER